jgi:hypothetical protein
MSTNLSNSDAVTVLKKRLERLNKRKWELDELKHAHRRRENDIKSLSNELYWLEKRHEESAKSIRVREGQHLDERIDETEEALEAVENARTASTAKFLNSPVGQTFRARVHEVMEKHKEREAAETIVHPSECGEEYE